MSLPQALAAVSTVASAVQGNKQAKQAKKATQAQEREASRTAAAAEADISRREARTPDIAAISDRNRIGATEGGQTLLTGSTGVPSSSLLLAQKSLLGQ